MSCSTAVSPSLLATSRSFVRFFAGLIFVLCAVLPSLRAAESAPPATITAAGTTGTSTPASAQPADPAADPHPEETVQVLVFADGDRARGRLIAREGDTIVFQTARFGILRVPAGNAKVIDESVSAVAVATAPAIPTSPSSSPSAAPTPTEPARRYGMAKLPPAEPLAVLPPAMPPAAPGTPPATAPTATPAEPPVTGVASWLRWTQPVQLAALLRDIFGSWHGRFSVSSSMVSGSTETKSASVETKLQRKWKRDDVSLTGRYEFGQTSGLTSSDVLKANGVWRHTLSRKLFATYRPTLEWNRSSVSKGRAVDYLLLQQEIGAGVALYNRPAFKLRVGLAEAMFDNWVLTDDTHTGRRKESVFSELEMTLPWRGTLTNRGSYYYSLGGESAGWENQFELGKKFTDTLSLSLRHEIRQTKTDERIEDYALWRLLVGFDF